MHLDHKEFRDRIKSVRKRLEESRLEALIAYSTCGDALPGNVSYLSNFQSAEEEGQSAVVITRDKEVLVIDIDWEMPRAREDCPFEAKYCADLSQGIIDTFSTSGVSRGNVGVAGWHHLPAYVYLGITEKCPQVKLHETRILQEMRAIKSRAETKLMREAARITDIAHEVALRKMKPGVPEWRVVAAAEKALLFEGARPSFISEFGSGTRTALVNPLPTNRKIKRGDLCLLDMGAAYRCYRGDIARMKVVGRPIREQRDLMDLEYECLKKAIAAVRPGAICSEVHRIGKQPIVEAGYEKHGGWTASGHSNGLEQHEWPFLDERTDVLLEKGMIFCVEPGFTIPDKGTFRLEQMVLVTETGHETLTKCQIQNW
jgi:Xaa-Pro aminopeptidase